MKVSKAQLSPTTASAQLGETLMSPSISEPRGWQDVVSRVSTYLSSPPSKAPTPTESLRQLTGLLRLQMDVARYQLRVEVVSKIAESGVASLRKLQQSQ
jgi:hypothetical protein